MVGSKENKIAKIPENAAGLKKYVAHSTMSGLSSKVSSEHIPNVLGRPETIQVYLGWRHVRFEKLQI